MYRYARKLADSRAWFRVVVSYFGKVDVHQSMSPATPTHPLCVAEDSAAGEGTNTAPCKASNLVNLLLLLISHLPPLSAAIGIIVLVTVL